MIWRNTRTLDHFIPTSHLTSNPRLATFAVVGSSPIPVEELTNLKAIFRCGVGTDNIDFDYCEERGIHVELPSKKSSEIIFEETANFAVKCILDGLYHWQGDLSDWTKKDRATLRQRKVLLLGLGNIGTRVRDKIISMVNLMTWDPINDSPDKLLPMLNDAEVVSLHMPLNDQTIGWFDAKMLAAMPDGSVLVNTARGAIVSEIDLLNEIESFRITAIFDVFWDEPYEGPLRRYHPDRFVMSPHIASHCHEFIESLAEDFGSLVVSWGANFDQ